MLVERNLAILAQAKEENLANQIGGKGEAGVLIGQPIGELARGHDFDLALLAGRRRLLCLLLAGRSRATSLSTHRLLA